MPSNGCTVLSLTIGVEDSSSSRRTPRGLEEKLGNIRRGQDPGGDLNSPFCKTEFYWSQLFVLRPTRANIFYTKKNTWTIQRPLLEPEGRLAGNYGKGMHLQKMW